MSTLRPEMPEHPLVAKYRDRFEAGQAEAPLTYAETAEIFGAFRKLDQRVARIARISDRYQAEIRVLVEDLREALDKIRILKGCLPICASCKKIRNDEGYWKQLEQFLAEHSELFFSHGLCPDCAASYRALSHLPPRPPSSASLPVAEGIDPADLEDPVVAEFLPLVNNQDFADSPLAGAFAKLYGKYLRLSRRLKRIARISDNFQASLQELKSRLDQESRSDFLTGLANRREIVERLEAESSRANRHGREFSIIMLDLDRFKQVNDRFGHGVGDQVLILVARLLVDHLRREESCGRWGGEEFLLLLPETGRAQALAVAEKIRRLVADRALEIEGQRIRVSASLGVTGYRLGESVEDCVARADAALYRAKNGGRNRVALPAGADADPARP